MTEDEIRDRFERAAEIARVVPEHLQAVAFNRALDFLSGHESSQAGRRTTELRNGIPHDRDHDTTIPTEEEFFARLASESGVADAELRDILRLLPDGTVHVISPTKDLGTSVAEQAKSIIVLVAGARSKGVGEHPVSVEAVRKELERKHCYQSNNFAHSHLGRLKGFSAGSKGEILVTAKWLDEFKAVMARVKGAATSPHA